MKVDNSLLFKFFDNEHTPGEADAISAWLRESKANEQEFEKAYKLFVVSTLATKGLASSERQVADHQPGRSHRIFNWVMSGVASVAAAAAIAMGVFFNSKMQNLRDAQEAVMVSEAKLGKQLRQVLSDGTVVELNSGSKIEYPAVFIGEERRVRLSGEAVFQVTHDEEHPFIVETFAYDVKVLGTTFDVIANSEENEFSATLIEGKVSVCDKASGNGHITLAPNQRAYLSDGKLKMETLDDVYSDVLWTNDQLSIGGLSFEDLMRKVERCYGVQIQIDRPTPPEQGYAFMKVHISEGVEHLFRQLQKASDFTYYFDDNDGKYHIR